MRARFYLGFSLFLLAATPAFAQSGSDAQCAAIADSARRLACYDATHTSLPAKPAPPLAASGSASQWPEFSVPPAAAFAKPQPRAVATGNPLGPSQNGKLVAGVASYSLSPHGKFTLVLDNGEVWQQLDSDDGMAQFNRKGSNSVVISKGFWHSYDLRLNSMSAVFKVSRVK